MTKSALMSRPLSRPLSRALLCAAALPMLAAVCAAPAPAQTVEGSGPSRVMMFERPPSVDELREVVAPEPKIRTRSIEIIGGAAGAAAKRPRPVDEINYGVPTAAPTAAQPEAQPDVQPLAQPTAQPAPSRPVPRRHRQEARQETKQEVRQEARVEQPAAEPAAGTPDPAPQAFGFRINFALNSAEIPAESASYIDSVGSLMKEDPSLALTVEGHTDASGSLAYNMLLSQRRAVSVGEYLVRVHRIDPKRITVDGKGPATPVAADPYDGRNRRVEFKPTH